eukprot:TRINITY_DN17322_c0_g1_i1.p1 TRINITY_DN17322_c0_g1~~TRINITY_DN17322_c0_g1_i1.p1  ORF type:complete len:364 (+),score=55.79 TRINITY_DN17322_c0_g1_i1:70-1161(+)
MAAAATTFNSHSYNMPPMSTGSAPHQFQPHGNPVQEIQLQLQSLMEITMKQAQEVSIMKQQMQDHGATAQSTLAMVQGVHRSIESLRKEVAPLIKGEKVKSFINVDEDDDRPFQASSGGGVGLGWSTGSQASRCSEDMLGHRFNRSAPGLSLQNRDKPKSPSGVDMPPPPGRLHALVEEQLSSVKKAVAPQTEGYFDLSSVPSSSSRCDILKEIRFQENPPRVPPEFMTEEQYFKSLATDCEAVACELIRNSPADRINKANQNGMTALHFAASRGSALMCRSIIERPDFFAARDVDAQGNTAIHIAAIGGSYEVCKVLLDHDPSLAIVRSNNANGQTAAELAMASGADPVRNVFRQCLERRRA